MARNLIDSLFNMSTGVVPPSVGQTPSPQYGSRADVDAIQSTGHELALGGALAGPVRHLGQRALGELFAEGGLALAGLSQGADEAQFVGLKSKPGQILNMVMKNAHPSAEFANNIIINLGNKPRLSETETVALREARKVMAEVVKDPQVKRQMDLHGWREDPQLGIGRHIPDDLSKFELSKADKHDVSEVAEDYRQAVQAGHLPSSGYIQEGVKSGDVPSFTRAVTELMPQSGYARAYPDAGTQLHFTAMPETGVRGFSPGDNYQDAYVRSTLLDTQPQQAMRTSTHELSHAGLKYEGVPTRGVSASVDPSGTSPGQRVLDMIKEIPLHKLARLPKQLINIRRAADAGMSPFDALYHNSRTEALARSVAEDYAELPMHKLKDLPAVSPNQIRRPEGADPEDYIVNLHPDMWEDLMRAVGFYHGGTQSFVEGKGKDFLYKKYID